MGQLNVTNIPGSLPVGYCWPSSPQQYYNDIIDLLTSYVSGEFSSFVLGDSTPDPEYNDLPWIKLDASGNLDGLYIFGEYGAWARPHPVPASSDIRMLWVGVESDLQTFDGGEVAAVSATTGPFWEADHDFDFRFPLGAGTSPGGTVVAAGDTGGEEEHTLTVDELAEHQHAFTTELCDNDLDETTPPAASNGSNTHNVHWNKNTELEGGGEPHNNMPPYRGVFIIKRTARIYYRG